MWSTASAGVTVMPRTEDRTRADARRAIPGWRALAVYLVLVSLCLAALNNVITYRAVIGWKWEESSRLAKLLDRHADGEEVSAEARDRRLRNELYSLLLSLDDTSLKSGKRSAVVVADPAFHQGAYIDRPFDTILERCAIQPFAIPALTGMPLLGGLDARNPECRYDSYGYQYLPKHAAAGQSAPRAPCALAGEGAFDSVFVIDRHEAGFTATRVDCARQ